ncbi:hypothetical protein [Acetobacter pasteurianus]|uniref:hypothetical protein n=1 Tax=Acetobacter pasteurianus TaxID=438 RepID=UPI0003842DE5|nr:hypothetical protein [Acetobacter pasteurianus]CCT58543.1 hypothetical protein APA386B_427 [Acetobacter pasteurianus 386B]
MRTRAEQVAYLTGVYEDAGVTGDNAKDEAAAQVLEAEQRGYERAKAECAADTRHYPVRYSRTIGRNIDEMKSHLLKGSLYPMGDAVLIWANEGDLYMPGSAVLIDAAMEGGK